MAITLNSIVAAVDSLLRGKFNGDDDCRVGRRSERRRNGRHTQVQAARLDRRRDHAVERRRRCRGFCWRAAAKNNLSAPLPRRRARASGR